MKAYNIRFKKTARARKVHTWTRHAENEAAARESAEKALDKQYAGEAELLSVTRSSPAPVLTTESTEQERNAALPVQYTRGQSKLFKA